jgi:hypothetical protein
MPLSVSPTSTHRRPSTTDGTVNQDFRPPSPGELIRSSSNAVSRSRFRAGIMCHRIRAAMKDTEFAKLMGQVEVDETGHAR